MKKSFDVKVVRSCEETHRVSAISMEDALENWDTDGEMIERDEEHGELTDVMSVTVYGGSPMSSWSVLLCYPTDENRPPETYFAHVWAATVSGAVRNAQDMAVAANAEGVYDHEDFYPLIVLAGHVEAEAFGGEVHHG